MRPYQLGSPGALASDLRRSVSEEPPDGRNVERGRGPLSLRLSTWDDLAVAERELRSSIFKPTDGRFGRFNRRISIPISVALVRSMRLSAHAMSAFVIVLGMYAGWLFSRGDYISGVFAAMVSLAASILDGCDGELARLQYKDSAFGCWLDTLGDYTYYLAIFIGLTVGAARHSGWSGFWWIGGALLLGSLLTIGLLVLLRERITDGQPDRLRTTTKAHFYASGKRWAWLVARLSPCATRATMPYGILGLAILGMLPAVVVLGAIGAQIYWISLAVELRRLLEASHGRRRSGDAIGGVQRSALSP
jgi:phosphatidylglycerophosphate synthase